MPSPRTTSMASTRLLNTTTSSVWPVAVLRTVIFSSFIRPPKVLACVAPRTRDGSGRRSGRCRPAARMQAARDRDQGDERPYSLQKNERHEADQIRRIAGERCTREIEPHVCLSVRAQPLEQVQEKRDEEQRDT